MMRTNTNNLAHASNPSNANSSKGDLKLSSSRQIRTRLLLNLGINSFPREAINDSSVAAQTAGTASQNVSTTSSKSALGTVVPFIEPLKYSRSFDEKNTPASPTSSLSDNFSIRHKSAEIRQRKKRKGAITFDDSVSVVPIPHHAAYSDRVRNRIWSDRFELMLNVRRNTMEFASEGWDWRNVVEDEALRFCPETGELVHPVHHSPKERPHLSRGVPVFEATS